MTQQELKKLSRLDLIEMLLNLTRENEQLLGELEENRTRLADRAIAIEEAGSLAEATVRLNGVMEAAEATAQQYLQNIRQRCEEQAQTCARNEQESQEKCAQLEQQTQESCAQLEQQTQEKCAQLEQQTQEKCAQLEQQTQEKCAQLEQQTQEKCAQLEQQTQEKCIQLQQSAQKQVDDYLQHINSRLAELSTPCIWQPIAPAAQDE